MKIPGLPNIVDFHVMNNRRFVLTKDSANVI